MALVERSADWSTAQNIALWSHRVELLEAAALDPVSLLRHERVVMTVAALRSVEEKLT